MIPKVTLILLLTGLVPCFGVKFTNKKGQSFNATVVGIVSTNSKTPAVRIKIDGKPYQVPLSELSEETLIALLIDQSTSRETAPPRQEIPTANSSVYYKSFGLRKSNLYPRLNFQGDGKEGLHGFFTDLLKKGPHEIVGKEARDLLRKYFQLPFLPIDKVQKIVIGKGTMEIIFNFGGNEREVLAIPEGKVWILPEKELKVEVAGQPKLVKFGGHKISIGNSILATITATGIQGIRKGDMQYAGLIPVVLNIKTEHIPKKILMHNRKVVLEADAKGQPLVKDGRYVPQKFDEWMFVDTNIMGVMEVPIPSN